MWVAGTEFLGHPLLLAGCVSRRLTQKWKSKNLKQGMKTSQAAQPAPQHPVQVSLLFQRIAVGLFLVLSGNWAVERGLSNCHVIQGIHDEQSVIWTSKQKAMCGQCSHGHLEVASMWSVQLITRITSPHAHDPHSCYAIFSLLTWGVPHSQFTEEEKA